MILPLHISVALLSLVYCTLLFFYPSKLKLRITYSLVAVMLSSGFYLVLANPARMVTSCVTGLIYLGIVSVAIVSAQHKLALLKK